MSDENNNLENEVSETNQKTELIDSSLAKGIIVILSVYLISFSLLSFVFGNTFAAVIATPLTGASYLLLARWDRLRESREISWQNIKLIFVEAKISPRTLLLGILVILIVQVLAAILAIFFANMFYPNVVCDACDTANAGFLDFMENNPIRDTWIGMINHFFAIYVAFFLGGYFSAKSAIRKNLAPYKHAVLSTLAFFFSALAFTSLLYFINRGESFLPLDDGETSIGAQLLLFSSFILSPLIGAHIVVRKFKAKEIEKAKKAEEDKKRKEDNAKLVASEIERLSPEIKKQEKKKVTSNKRKKSLPTE